MASIKHVDPDGSYTIEGPGRDRALDLYQEGFSVRQIARRMKETTKTIRQALTWDGHYTKEELT